MVTILPFQGRGEQRLHGLEGHIGETDKPAADRAQFSGGRVARRIEVGNADGCAARAKIPANARPNPLPAQMISATLPVMSAIATPAALPLSLIG